MVAAALWTNLQVGISILVAAVQTAVAVVVHRTVAHVVLVHHVYHACDDRRVVGSIAVYFYIEDVAATGQVVVRSLDLSLLQRCTLVVYRHMVGVGIVITVGNARDDAKLLAVLLGKLAAQALGWSSQHGVVVVILLAEFVGTVAHVGHDLQTQLLSFLALAVVLADERLEALCQSDESDTQSSVVDNALYGVGRVQLVSAHPEILHQQWELLCHGSLLELEALVQLLGSDIQQVVELGKEHVDALLLVLDAHALDGELHDVDGREAQVATCDAGLLAPAVLEYAGTATHGSNLPLVALRVVSSPLLVLVECSIQVQEVREETAGCHLACKLVEVVVSVLRQIVYASLLLPYLDREDGCLAVAHAVVGAEQYFAHDAATLGTGICTIVDA